MPPAARTTDMHTCPMVTGVVPHVGGPILPPGHPTTLIGFLPAARVGDMVTCVGPPDVIVKGSPTVLIGNMMAARMGDNTAHGGVIVLGHPTTMIGDAGTGGGGGGGAAGGAQPASQEQAQTSPASEAASIQAAMMAAAQSGTALVASPPPDETAEDPKSTFAVKVVMDETDEPVWGVKLKITLPDGQEETHTTDQNGKVEIDDLDEPGQCTVTCAIKDARLTRTFDFVGMGEAPIDQQDSDDEEPAPLPPGGDRRIIAEIEEHKVKTGESLESLARANGMTWQELARFNWGTDVPSEINEHLAQDVGCTRKTRDGKNYVFTSEDDPGIIYIPKEWSQEGLATEVEHTIRVRSLTYESNKAWLGVQIYFHEQPIEDLEVEFFEARASDKAGAAVGEKLRTNQNGIAQLEERVPIGNYVCRIENQPDAAITSIPSPDEPYKLALPIGRPYFEYDAYEEGHEEHEIVWEEEPEEDGSS